MAENGLGYLYLVFGLSYVTTTLGVSRGITIVGIMLSTLAEFFCVAIAPKTRSTHPTRRAADAEVQIGKSGTAV